MGLIYEKDFKKYKQSEKKKDPRVSHQNVHQGRKAGSKQKKSQGRKSLTV